MNGSYRTSGKVVKASKINDFIGMYGINNKRGVGYYYNQK